MPAGELIRRYVEVARPIILDDFAPNCCIAATAITLGVFRSLGIRAEPFSCRVVIFNRAFIDRSERAGRVPQTPAEVREWTGDGLSWSLGVGWPAPHLTGWPGHLVALVEDALIDASIEQANRPAKGIVLPPVLAAKAPSMNRAKIAPGGTLRTGYPQDGAAVPVAVYSRKSEWFHVKHVKV